MDSGGGSPAEDDENAAFPGQERTATEADEQAPLLTPPRDRRKRYSEADRLERRRARNRAAQARFRQKQRDARSALETRINERQRKISSMRATCASLRLQKQDIRLRITMATTALAAQTSAHTDSAANPTEKSTSTAGSADRSAGLRGLWPSETPAQASADFPVPPQPPPTSSPQHAAATPRSPTLAQHSSMLLRRQPHSTHRAQSMLPPAISSFQVCAGIAYRDILEASGDPGRYVDFSQCSLRALIGACKAQKATRLHTLPADVCWFVLSEYEAAPGLQLSYSATLSTPECVASVAIHFLLLNFEFALCTAAADHGVPGDGGLAPDLLGAPIVPTSSPYIYNPEAFQQPSGMLTPDREWHGDTYATMDQPPRHSCPLPSEDLGPPHSELPFGTIEHSFDRLRARIPSAASGNGYPAPASRSTAQQTQHGPPDMPQRMGVHGVGMDGGEDPGYMPQRTEYTAHTARAAPAAGAPRVWSGDVSCGVNQQTSGRAAIRATVRALSAAYRPWVRPAALRSVCCAHASHMEELMRSFPVQAADMHGAEADLCEPEGLAYHSAVTEALGCVLGELRDSMRDMAGLINVMAGGPFPAAAGEPSGPPPWQGGLPPSMGGGCASAALQERGFVAMVSYDIGHVLTLTHAGRVMRRLAVNGTIPVMKNYEVENMHVLVYRTLSLTPEQRVSLAAHWHLWERRRRSLDTPVATARNLLASLPQFIPLPAEFAQRIFDVADGAVAPPHPHAWPQRAQHAPWERESVVPLLGAAPDVTSAALEATRVLRYSLTAESGVGVEMTSQRLQPGELLGLEQLLRLYSVHLLHRQAPPIDFMALCQLAATQLRWEEQRRQPAYDRWQALQADVGGGGGGGAMGAAHPWDGLM